MSQATPQAAAKNSGKTYGAWVPGLPQLLNPERNTGYAQLAQKMQALGDELYDSGVRRVIYYSTQWISVLGHSFQAKKALSGVHVDENWYELGDLPFAFRIDGDAAQAMAAAAAQAGYQARLIDYDGFPVDTGTIVADRLINKDRFTTGMVSCCVYSDYADTVKLSGVIAEALARDGVKTAYVAVSGLSGRYFTTEIDTREDHVSSPDDERLNRRWLELLGRGALQEAEALLPSYTAQCKVDMGGKALAFLKGTQTAIEGRQAAVEAYGALYGTGATVVRF